MPAPDLSTPQWRKSSRSSDQPNCVEIAITAGAVAVRDSKHPIGGSLLIPPLTWTAFTTALRANEFG
ncbi:MAG: DUF397 domain-containing protein [Pseudonocardiaceae bacterium]